MRRESRTEIERRFPRGSPDLSSLKVRGRNRRAERANPAPKRAMPAKKKGWTIVGT